jgi:hypothetical protein
VSTIEQHETIAQMFAQQIKAKAIVTDEVNALSNQITSGQTDAREKAKAIYDWMRRNIKYTAIYLANGGWEPHDMAHILKTRYGDCKDQVTLMLALLKAQGIAAEPTLVNTFNEFAADPVPVASSYNHTILYLPELKKFLDPTASHLPFQGMSYSLHGKPVVRSDGIVATRDWTPVIQPADNTSHAHTVLTISNDGSAQMRIIHKVTGMNALAEQSRLANFRPEFEIPKIQSTLTSLGYLGRGRFLPGPINKESLEQSNTWNLYIHDLLPDASAGALSPHPGLNIHTHISQTMGNYTQAKRDFGWPCAAFKVLETFQVTFDPKFNVLRIPKGLSIDVPGIRFHSEIKLENNVITGFRSIEFSHKNADCTVAEYTRRRGSMMQIAKHLKSPVLYMQAE